LKSAARGSLKIQDAKNRQKLAIWELSHNILSGCIFATKACIDNRKKLLNGNISSTCRVVKLPVIYVGGKLPVTYR